MTPKVTIRHDTTVRHLKKYNNRNPFHRLTLSRFFDTVAEKIKYINPGSVLDFGCGEGLFLQQLKMRDVRFQRLVGIDLRYDALQYARTLNPEYEFVKADLLTWNHSGKSFDLVIASQVLEHLHDPGRFLERMAFFSREHLLLTVPWEPWFRMTNLLRGRDIPRLGNHPEHVNQWGLDRFCRFASKYVRIEDTCTVFPFIVIVARI